MAKVVWRKTITECAPELLQLFDTPRGVIDRSILAEVELRSFTQVLSSIEHRCHSSWSFAHGRASFAHDRDHT